MYNVTAIRHKKHGDVVEIVQAEDGPYETPFWAVQAAKKEKRLLLEAGAKKIKFLVNGKVLALGELEHWSNEEYKSLPKCQRCAHLLNGDVYTHRLCGSDLFCSRDCADQDYAEKTEIDNDESEFELL